MIDWKKTMYAIVDIETTGGYAEANGITEIAIFVHDGSRVVDSFCTLIDPGRPIPNYISGFTGITNEMVEKAPSFENVAHRVFEMLEHRVFVAHNVNFDYSFIRNQLAQSGYHLQAKKLCTVRYSRKIYPGLSSYSLGNICAHLGISISSRHRAGGDAEATVKLLENLLATDDGSVLKSFLKRGSKEYMLPPNLPREQFDTLPEKTGVYYFHDETGKVIYVGKAVNLRKRVGQHFSGQSTGSKRQDFMREIHAITYTEYATELMALIQESIEIKKHWPRHNRAQKHLDYAYAIYQYEDQNGYLHLCIDRIRKMVKPLTTFRTRAEATERLQKLTLEFDLCPKFCHLTESSSTCNDQVCRGACRQEESVYLYNQRAGEAICALEWADSYAIIGKGRMEDEVSCILIDQGRFYGMGYISGQSPEPNIDSLREVIQPQRENFFIRELIDSDALAKWGRKIKLVT